MIRDCNTLCSYEEFHHPILVHPLISLNSKMCVRMYLDATLLENISYKFFLVFYGYMEGAELTEITNPKY